MTNIESTIGKAALLEQLAEESTELAKAALKQARIIRGDNPTPVTLDDAISDVIEEFTDVVHCARELGLNVDEGQIVFKSKRWVDRIKRQIINNIRV